MCFDVIEARTVDTSSLPDRLATIDRIAPEAAVRTRDFEFAADLAPVWNFPPISWNINGARFDPDRAVADSRLGDTEIWHFSHRRSTFPGRHVHPAHVHLVHFQILERNGAAPPPHEAGWKDAVRLEQGDDVRLIARFGDYRGRYILHCHNLEHEDHSMMARFDVT
jgi:spore coat protein A, manganese oxidase